MSSACMGKPARLHSSGEEHHLGLVNVFNGNHYETIHLTFFHKSRGGTGGDPANHVAAGFPTEGKRPGFHV